MSGIFLIIIGAIFLLKNLGFISADTWDVLWPALLILFGIGLLVRKRNGDFFLRECFGWRKHKIKEDA